MKIRTRSTRMAASALAAALLVTACSSDGGDTDTDSGSASTDEAAADGEAVSGTVAAAGSSTVLPVAEIILEEYIAAQPDVDASYDSVGSGGGFERLCDSADVDLSGASRAIKDEEAQLCADNGVEFIELAFGVDALTMITSPETDYVECMSTDDIIEVFGPDAATSWDAVLDGAPAEPIEIFAPDADSGTYGFMVEDVMGLEESTQDYSASADDNVIVQGIQSGAGTWGFLGLAYYESNADGLKAIAHENSETGECVLPSIETAQDGSYELVRPLYIYVNTASLEEPAVADFVQFFLDNAPAAVDFVGYVNSEDALSESQTELSEALG